MQHMHGNNAKSDNKATVVLNWNRVKHDGIPVSNRPRLGAP